MRNLRKTFIVGLFCVIMLSAHAMSDISTSSLGLGLSFPYSHQNYNISGMDSIVLSGFGINLNWRTMPEHMMLGFFLDTDVFFPSSKTVNIDENYMTTTQFSDYDYFFGIDVLGGFYTVVYQAGSLSIPFGLGLHLDGYSSKLDYKDYEIKESVYTLGIGAWLNLEVNISKRFGIYAGTKFIYDFYYQLNENNSSYKVNKTGRCTGFTFVPVVGAIWHF